MENRDGEIHMETDEARGASSPNVVRWVLGIGLLLAIVGMSLAWIIPAMNHGPETLPSQNAQRNMESAQDAANGRDAGVVPDAAAHNRDAANASKDEGAVPSVANSGAQGQ